MPATRNFFQNEKILFIAKVIAFSNSKIGTYKITLRVQTLIAIPQKSPPTVLRRPLKLVSHVLGTKTKLFIIHIFDLALRNKNIEFENCRWPKDLENWLLANLKNQYFHF